MEIKLLKKKYICVFLVKEQENYSVLKTQKISPTDTSIRFSEEVGTVIVDTSKPTYSKGLSLFYLVDLSTKEQLHFDNHKDSNNNAKVMDMILQDSIISQLTANLNDYSQFKFTIANLLLGAVIGALIGFIVASYIPLGVVPSE